MSLLLLSTALASVSLPVQAQQMQQDGMAAQQAPAAPNVQAFRVEGAQRLEPDTVISYLNLAKGEAATPEKLNEALKSLYATGLFADVNLRMDGDTLLVKVEENPIVNRVTFEGNDAINKEDLEKEVQLKPRLVYTLPRLQKDVQRILDLYRRSGRFGAMVEPKLVKLEQNRVDIIFEISEGDHTGVRRINFIGNTHYSESELRDIVNTRESAWWRIFSTSDFYDPDRMNYDRELLRRFYLNEGYVDFRVVSSVAELTPDRKAFFLTFTIEEGPRYKFGKIDIQSDIKGIDTASLRQHLTTFQGDWYSADQAEKTITKLTTVLGDLQYAFVDITPDITRHKDGLTIDVTYRIKEGPRVYIGRIDVSGNARTWDKVIRRELQLAEGDPFSSSKIKRSEQRIKDLGYFEDVKIEQKDGTQPDRADLAVQVKEKATGEISFGAGFSTTDGPLGDFSIRERNFLGRGQDVRLGATVSGVTRQFDFSFTEPYFLDRDLNAGFDIFHVRRDNQSQSSYDERNTGFTLRMGYPLSEQLRQRLNYTFRRDEISNVPNDASRFIRAQEGESNTSLVGQELTYDTRDSKLEPNNGYVVRLNTDLAGLGGDRRFGRMRLGATQYLTLAEDYILSTAVEGGYIWGLNQRVRISDRFFLGGDSLRGFEFAGVGPRDLTGGVDDALGGNRFSRVSVELTTPLPVPSEFGFKGHIFTDAGTLGRAEESPLPNEKFRDNESIRVSVGAGVTWQSPFGPVRLDLAQAVKKENYDKTQTVHFSFGTRF
jgi:outer membrane protein insertion porin family